MEAEDIAKLDSVSSQRKFTELRKEIRYLDKVVLHTFSLDTAPKTTRIVFFFLA